MPKKKKIIDDKKAYEAPSANFHERTGVITDGDMNEIFDGIDFDKISRDDEKKRQPEPPILKPVHARILGACVILVVVVGILLSALGINSAVAAAKAEKERRDEIADYISPVVAIGFQPYDNLSDVDMVMLLRCAALHAVENNKDELKQNESGRTELPVYMLKSAITDLFGDDIDLKYYSFDIDGLLFEYDEQNKCYLYSAVGINPVYVPEIVTYSKSSDAVTVCVKYKANNGEINAYNDMEYIYKIKQSDGFRQIVGIKKK